MLVEWVAKDSSNSRCEFQFPIFDPNIWFLIILVLLKIKHYIVHAITAYAICDHFDLFRWLYFSYVIQITVVLIAIDPIHVDYINIPFQKWLVVYFLSSNVEVFILHA